MKKLAIVLIIAGAGAFAWFLVHSQANMQHASQPAVDSDGTAFGVGAPEPAAQPVKRAAPGTPGAAARAGGVDRVALAPSAERAQALVSKITDAVFSKSSFSRADAEGLKQQLDELKSQGVLAIPAVREFLAKNQDVNFSTFPELDNTLGVASLRLALMEVFQATSGPEVVAAAGETLKSTGDPTEIATLAAVLEKNEPGEHRGEAVKAAADSLSLAGSGQLMGQRVSPAFEVLQTYGDTNVLPLLRDQVNGKWAQNAAIAMAELPDGAGIPALISLVKDPSAGPGADAALRPLAQVAARYPAAFDALVEQARQGKIPDTEWPTVASALAASDYVSNGNVLPETRSPAADLHGMLPQRLELMERLAGTSGLSEAALRALQQQRGQLMARIAANQRP